MYLFLFNIISVPELLQLGLLVKCLSCYPAIRIEALKGTQGWMTVWKNYTPNLIFIDHLTNAVERDEGLKYTVYVAVDAEVQEVASVRQVALVVRHCLPALVHCLHSRLLAQVC